MDQITFENGIAIALDAVLNERLALLAGAGLSMAPPSCIPSAAAIAARAKAKYDATYGNTRPSLPAAIEEQAEFFFNQNQLATVYFHTYIDRNAFAAPPNPGHVAVADLLLIRGIQTGITTNVDFLVETAGMQLYGQVGAGIDVATVAALPPTVAPLLKIHGCRATQEANMVWAPGQVDKDPVKARIATSAAWLFGRLQNRDLVIVGYSTDWDYLNVVLGKTLGAINPSNVVIVDPSPAAGFIAKCPDLNAIGLSATVSFRYVQASGADFLDELRRQVSQTYIRRALNHGVIAFEARKATPALALWTEPPAIETDLLWMVRRDLEGCRPGNPASTLVPAAEANVGMTILELRAAGATPDGPYWHLNNKSIRVLRAPNSQLHEVENDFRRELAPVAAPDFVVAVGAESQILLANYARAPLPPSITRGKSGKWLTRDEAVTEFNL